MGKGCTYPIPPPKKQNDKYVRRFIRIKKTAAAQTCGNQ